MFADGGRLPVGAPKDMDKFDGQHSKQASALVKHSVEQLCRVLTGGPEDPQRSDPSRGATGVFLGV